MLLVKGKRDNKIVIYCHKAPSIYTNIYHNIIIFLVSVLWVRASECLRCVRSFTNLTIDQVYWTISSHWTPDILWFYIYIQTHDVCLFIFNNVNDSASFYLSFPDDEMLFCFISVFYLYILKFIYWINVAFCFTKSTKNKTHITTTMTTKITKTTTFRSIELDRQRQKQHPYQNCHQP